VEEESQSSVELEELDAREEEDKVLLRRNVFPALTAADEDELLSQACVTLIIYKKNNFKKKFDSKKICIYLFGSNVMSMMIRIIHHIFIGDTIIVVHIFGGCGT
jgi:hypothetical protein